MKITDLSLWAPLCTLLDRVGLVCAPLATELAFVENSVQNRDESHSVSRPLKSR
jgi:hypothetical protein